MCRRWVLQDLFFCAPCDRLATNCLDCKITPHHSTLTHVDCRGVLRGSASLNEVQRDNRHVGLLSPTPCEPGEREKHQPAVHQRERSSVRRNLRSGLRAATDVDLDLHLVPSFPGGTVGAFEVAGQSHHLTFLKIVRSEHWSFDRRGGKLRLCYSGLWFVSVRHISGGGPMAYPFERTLRSLNYEPGARVPFVAL